MAQRDLSDNESKKAFRHSVGVSIVYQSGQSLNSCAQPTTRGSSLSSIIDEFISTFASILHFQHDPDQCTPGGEDGNFIMFARATSGDKRNNNKFSPCSLKAIEPVLNAKARSSKGCFTGKLHSHDALVYDSEAPNSNTLK